MLYLNKNLKHKIIEIVVHKFPDGELNLSLNQFKNHVNKGIFIQKFYPNINEKIIESILIFSKEKIKNLILVASYIPYSRGENFKIISEILLNYFEKIITIDIHNKDFISEKIINIGTEKIFADKIENLYKNKKYKNIALISPDNGSLDRVIRLHKELKSRKINSHYYHGTKTRTEKITINLPLPKNISDYECLIIDDIIDSGNTIFKVQKILESKQVKLIDAFITHPILASINPETQADFYHNLMKFNKLYFTNTVDIKFSHPKVEILPIETLIIDFISNNEDI